MASGISPFFGVNAGNAGIAMLAARDEKWKAYQTAKLEADRLMEEGRSNRANESYSQTIADANLYGQTKRQNYSESAEFKALQAGALESYKNELASIEAKYPLVNTDPAVIKTREEALGLAYQRYVDLITNAMKESGATAGSANSSSPTIIDLTT